MRTKQEIADVEVKEDVSADEILNRAEREELEELRAEREARKQAEKAIAEAELRALTSVTLNLPPAAGKGVQVAGRTYYHGKTYQVPTDLKWVLEEVERRAWAHESSLHESENKGRKQRRAYVGA